MVMIADSCVPLPGVTGLAIAHGLQKVRLMSFAVLMRIAFFSFARVWGFNPLVYKHCVSYKKAQLLKTNDVFTNQLIPVDTTLLLGTIVHCLATWCGL
jgi:hypothetical protein